MNTDKSFSSVVARIFTCCRPAALITLVTLAATGCGSDVDPRGERVAVWGSITLDGEPLPEGSIRIINDQGSGKLRANTGIIGGVFEFTKDNGPLAGQARVEIYPPTMELEQLDLAREGKEHGFVKIRIPERYNSRSELVATISADSLDEPLTFDLTTKH